MIAFTVPYPPSSNRMWRMARGHMILTSEARAYKESVGAIALTWVKSGSLPAYPTECLLSMTLKVYRPRKAGDLKNREKLLSDALNAIVYADDEQIIESHMYRYDDKANPRVEIVIEQVGTRPEKTTKKSSSKKVTA